MIRKYLPIISLALLASCQGHGNASQATLVTPPVAVDTVVTTTTVQPELPLLVCDTAFQNPALRCAALVNESASDKVLNKVDSLLNTDMNDLRSRCKQVFYPFSGPDFLYPFVLFPDADSYFLLGLEKTGTPITNEDISADVGKAYAKALSIYLRSSFFRTESMGDDFNSEEIDGTTPVLSMLMAKKDCQIISINYNKILADGTFLPVAEQTNCVEIRFFQTRTPHHEQVLYYFSGNAANSGLPKGLQVHLDQYLEEKPCVTFLKAASYLMYKSYFSKVRNLILDHSFAVLQDDSGIPYRYFDDTWDVTLYGRYLRPLPLFGEYFYQPDLDSLYHHSPVNKLNFRIGYNYPSNWMCARKRK